MKSIFATFLIFILLFGLLNTNIAEVLDGFWFPLICLTIFVIVVATAIFMFGLPTKKNFEDALKFKEKEVKNEKDN